MTAAAAEAFKVVVSSLYLGFFVLTPLRDRFRYSHLKTGIFFSVFVLLSMALSFLAPVLQGRYPEYKVFATALWIAYTVLIFHTAIKASCLEGLFIVLTAMNLYINIVTVIRLVSAGNVFVPEIKFLLAAGILIMYLPLLWIMMLKLYRAVIRFQSDIPIWRFAWIIPAATYAVFYLRIIRNYWYSPARAEMKDVSFCILWSLGTCIVLCLEFLFMLSVHKKADVTERVKILRARLEIQEEQYGQLLYSVRQSARLTHDWRHQLLTISGLAKERRLEELNRYLEELMPVCFNEADPQVCEHRVVNMILRHYRGKAKAEGVTVEMDTGIPQDLAVSDMDLSIVFGNLLENALDACTREDIVHRFICVKAAVKDESLVIMVTNSCCDGTETKGQSSGERHGETGLGLLSVRKVVEQYKGYMEVKQEQECFRVNIMIHTDAC